MGRGGKYVLNTFERMKKMFPNPIDLKHGIGIVITKGEPDVCGKDYFKLISSNICPSLKEFCDYFSFHVNKQVFIFPRALKENVGKQYTFKDHQKVKAFLKKDFLVNPVHQIALNKEAFTELIIIKDQLSRNIVDIIENFFSMINENWINSSILKKILEIMHLLLDIKISTDINYRIVIQKIFTSTDQLNSILQQIEDVEPVISFIDRIYQNDEINSYFKQTFIKSTQSEIKKLEVVISNLEKREKQAELIKEKQIIIQKYKVIEEKNQKLVYKNDQLEKQIKSNDLIINKLQQQLESQKKRSKSKLQ